jgi:hypothetical protein
VVSVAGCEHDRSSVPDRELRSVPGNRGRVATSSSKRHPEAMHDRPSSRPAPIHLARHTCTDVRWAQVAAPHANASIVEVLVESPMALARSAPFEDAPAYVPSGRPWLRTFRDEGITSCSRRPVYASISHWRSSLAWLHRRHTEPLASSNRLNNIVLAQRILVVLHLAKGAAR